MNLVEIIKKQLSFMSSVSRGTLICLDQSGWSIKRLSRRGNTIKSLHSKLGFIPCPSCYTGFDGFYAEIFLESEDKNRFLENKC